MLQLNKCILSRLWYTSLNIFQTNNDSSFLKEFHHNCYVDLTELETVVESLMDSPNEKQYQWIACVLLWKLLDNKSPSIDCHVRHNIQARLNYLQMRSAVELCRDVPDDLYKELLVLLGDTSIKQSGKQTSSAVSQQIVTFLRESLRTHPDIACWIINELTSVVSSPCDSIVVDLQDIYFSTLKSYLQDIPVRKTWYSSQVPESHSREADSAIQRNSLQTALCLLSKMNLDTDAEIKFLKTIYPILSRAYHVKDIELALSTSKNDRLFAEWKLLWNETHACSESASTLLAAYKVNEGICRLTENSEVLLCERELLKRITTRRLHWLNDILDICYILIRNEKYSKVELLLSCDLLKRLYPVLLFKMLNDCPQEEINSLESCESGILICESIKFLLDKCHSDLHTDCDFNQIHTLLKDHTKIAEYILHWKKRYFVKTRMDRKESESLQSNSIEQSVSVKEILSLLSKRSVLSVLKLTTDIYDQDHSAVQQVLKESSESHTFQAYCCVESALKAILLCELYNKEHEQVTKHFTYMVSHLSSLFPLLLRIEIIEDIFSLLFLRYEDFNIKDANSKDDYCDISLEKPNLKFLEVYERSGFIANRYALRDTLHHLWECISVTTRDIDACSQEDVQKLVRENLSVLTSALMDARWRLKFYVRLDFIENVGTPEEEPNNSPLASKPSETVISQRPNFPHRIKKDTFFYQGDSTSDETKIRSDSGSESGLLAGNIKRRKRSRSNMENADSATKDRSCMINLMLASKESLVLHCLWRSDLQKAREIIEMFHMENTQLDGEVRFSEAFHAFKQNTSTYLDTADKTDFCKGSSKTSTLENIRLVAQEGIQSSKYTSQFETFLASQETHLRMLNALTDVLNNNEMLTLSALDLSLTIGQTYQISNNLCNVAIKYVKLCKTLDNTEYANFFSKICQLFYESKDENVSVKNILCDARVPLSVKEWRESNVIWSSFENNYQIFNDTEKAGVIEAQSCDNNYISKLKSIKNISDIFNSEQKYFQNIYFHLQLLSTIIPDTDNVANLQITDLLRTPLHRYFGYQILDLHTEPEKLETVASSLQVNLIYSILVNACPNISYRNRPSCNSVRSPECTILNQNRNEPSVKTATIKKPNRCVSEILSELLQVLHRINPGRCRPNYSCLRHSSSHEDVRTVLSKTSRLAVLDLSELSVGDETLTFFVNVWNVMFLHASLDVWSIDPPLDSLRHTVSLMSIGYVIGDLGLVTLAALRSKLLGELAGDCEFFTRVEELNELAWQDLDLMQNPKVIFTMANEFYGTPEIRVYETRTLGESLNDAVRDYVSHYKSMSPDNESMDSATGRKISLPDLVRQYLNATSMQNVNAGAANGNVQPTDELGILNEDVVYISSNYTYDVVLKYSKRDRSDVESVTSIAQTPLWQTRVLRASLLQYLENHCWLLSYLIQRMHHENPTILENSCDNIKRVACLDNVLSSPWIDKLKLLFNDNQTLAAIHDGISARELWRYFEFKRENHNWHNYLEILNVLPDNVTRCDTELQRLKDIVLSHMLSNLGASSVSSVLQYLYQIKDVHILTQTILHNVNRWPMNVCEHALLHALQHEHNYKLPAHCKRRMNCVLCRITIFHKMIPYCTNKWNSTWYDVAYCTEKIDPFQIIRHLINADQFELCLEWLECQAFSLEIQPSLTQDFLIGLLRNERHEFKQALKFLQTLPSGQSLKICKAVLKKLESIGALQFIANYLLEHCRPAEKSKYRKILVGLEILQILDNKDGPLYIHLLKEPVLMLEQLLMNCKFENIQKILNTLHESLRHPDVGIENFDKIIRFYAKKSLDFRVSFQRDGIDGKPKGVPQSSLEAENNEFVMPVNVPTKEEWIPNDRARECSCCKAVIFSMFNRRHHCRRCGRVVCAVCSQHRVQVAGYPSSVLVRVCDDCKCQTVLQMRAVQDVPSVSSSEAFDYWRLTKDERHNRTIREEFSFEYAPNISLCLAILNLHSDHKMYTSFLLDRCDEMKQLLQPVSGGKINPEIDHALIIKMIRSLLIAAKVKCAKLGFNTGLAHCDRFLSQVDLIAILVQSDCLALIPTDDLDEHTLRKLRDLLTEKEQWTLALDVSTKAGLDTQGVWAAWGKACLKVGHFDQAKEKFHHCLDKIVHEDFDDWVLLSYPKELTERNKREMLDTPTSASRRNKVADEEERASDSGYSKRNEYSKCRPLKDPPLLTDILQILDNLSVHRSRAQHPSQSTQSDAAQEILQTLNSLKAVSQNQFNMKHLVAGNQTVYYQESLYYLLTYGSYGSILEFFLRHKEFDKCLAYILENDLDRDLFLNGVYLCCLKNGDAEKLHDAMRAKDPSLLVWRKYLLFICHFMERKQYWHILYQIQLFMKDCIRASMTCIRFYTNEASTYGDLHNKMHLLEDAQKHLESELQIESLSKRRRSTNSVHNGNQSVLAMEMDPLEIDRHINTICRQTEIAKFLANCEREDRAVVEFLNFFPDIDKDNSQTPQLPTLFGNQQQKVHLAVLAILCGRDIEEGFGIAFRIMQDYNLPQQKVYSLAGHVLALKNNVSAIEQLIKCCRSSGAPNAHVISDYVLTHCVKLLLNHSYNEQNPVLKNHTDALVRLITDTELRINAYIEGKQLKAAYLLAVKHSRAQDIRRILKEADRLGQSAIKSICLKWLQQESRE